MNFLTVCGALKKDGLNCIVTKSLPYFCRNRHIRTECCNNFQRLIPNVSLFHLNVTFKPVSTYINVQTQQHIISQQDWHRHRTKHGLHSRVILFAGLLNFFRLKKDDEDEQVLIMTMKRAILLIQNNEFKKAEQMLHIALRIAQDEQNADAITYIHDLMANLAFEQGDFKKAEVLFVSVMQRLLLSGVSQNDNKIIHMSLKLASMYTTTKQMKKAEDGFKFCVLGLQKKVDNGESDEDTLLLWAMTLDWFARFLLEENRQDEAFACFEKAYDLSVRINGPIHEQSVVLLNDLGTICCMKGDKVGALKYLNQAVDVGKHLPDMEDLGSVYVNLGTTYLKEGLHKESKKWCEEGWKNGKRHNNKEVLVEANKCLDELKLAFS